MNPAPEHLDVCQKDGEPYSTEASKTPHDLEFIPRTCKPRQNAGNVGHPLSGPIPIIQKLSQLA